LGLFVVFGAFLSPLPASAATVREVTTLLLFAGGILGFAFFMAALAYSLNELTRSKHRRHGHHHHEHRSFLVKHRRWIIAGVWLLAWLVILAGLFFFAQR
jgi:hypothetical protein